MENKLFESNRLQEVLDTEGLTQAKLARLTEDVAERISSGTINKRYVPIECQHLIGIKILS